MQRPKISQIVAKPQYHGRFLGPDLPAAAFSYPAIRVTARGEMISIILPTFNEAENLPLLVRQIAAVLRRAGHSFEIIVVDDASPDGTAESARRLTGCSVRVIERQGPRSLAHAVLKGFSAARGEICVVLDADLSHPVEKLPALIEPVLQGTVDAAVGSRYVPGGGCLHWPWFRRLGSRAAGLLARGLISLHDPTSGFMAVRRGVVEGQQFFPLGWKIVLEVLVRTRCSYVEVPILFADRRHGRSKLNWYVNFQYLAHLLRLYAAQFWRKPAAEAGDKRERKAANY